MPASEHELREKLAAVQAELAALKAKQAHEGDMPMVDENRNEAFRRMDASLWDKPILQDLRGLQGCLSDLSNWETTKNHCMHIPFSMSRSVAIFRKERGY